jgi:hypothetical protein
MMETPERYVAIVRAWLAGQAVTDVEGVVGPAALTVA